MTRSRSAVVGAIAAGLVAVTGVAGATLHAGRHGAGVTAAAAASGGQPAVTVERADRSAPVPRPRPVPRLRHLTRPDALVTLSRSATPHQLARLRHLTGIRAVTVADTGVMTLYGRSLRTLAVDVGSARGFTPKFTAESRPLWASVLKGEATVDYSMAGRMQPLLGATLPAATAGRVRAPLRIGAFASVGLGRTQALVDRSLSPVLHLRRAGAIVVAAPDRSDDGLRADLRAVFGERAHVTVLRPKRIVRFVTSAYARSVIPAAYLQLYQAAATTCRGLPWTVLAAIGTVETGNGSNIATSSKGAMGPMQFLPSTFRAYAVDANGDGVANILDPADSIYSAARYLCLNGAGLGGQALYSAIFAYNHADWYVRQVLKLAVAYS